MTCIWRTTLRRPLMAAMFVAALFTAAATPDTGAAAPNHPFLAGLSHGGLNDPCGAAVDSAGDLYVAAYGEATVRVYDPAGAPLTEFTPSANLEAPCGLALDSAGDVYVNGWGSDVVKYEPSEYPPSAATTYAPDTTAGDGGTIVAGGATSVAVDPAGGHVFVAEGDHVSSYQPDGTPISTTIGAGLVAGASYYGVDVLGSNGDVYVTDVAHNRAYVLNPAGTAILATIDGAGSPGGEFTAMVTSYLAVDQSNGHVYVADVAGHGVVDEFDASGNFVSELSHSFEEAEPTDVAVDNSGGPNDGGVYVTSGILNGEGNVYAFGPTVSGAALTVSKAGDGNGVVTSSPNGINCGTECSGTFSAGAEVTLTASPAAGSGFTGWSGACSGTGACHLTMDAAKDATATFETIPTVTTSAGAKDVTVSSGSVSGTVNPNGHAVTGCQLEYGTTAAYGLQVPCVPAPGAGTTPVVVSAEPNGLATDTTYHFRFVATSGAGTSVGEDRTFKTGGPPAVSVSVAGITATEAVLHAGIDPKGLPTTYHFEYVDDAHFQQEGFGGQATVATPEGAALAADRTVHAVAQALGGLEPGTLYRYRVIARNEGAPAGSVAAGAFATFAPDSAGLPDGRAYELVTPPEMGNATPTAAGFSGGDCFPVNLVTGDGGDLIFESLGGTMPGFEGNGVFDELRAVRGPTGWVSRLAGPTGAQTQRPGGGGCVSPDHGYSTWLTGAVPNDSGSLVLNGQQTSYLRNPAGDFSLAGTGSQRTDQDAMVRWIAASAAHIVFTSPEQLEPEAPAAVGPSPGNPPLVAVDAVYDRTPDGLVHVVSLLPGDATPPPGSSTFYAGTAADGSGVAFKVEEAGGATTLYLRQNDRRTLPVATASSLTGLAFAGVSADGSRVFYLRTKPSPALLGGGELFEFDAATGTSAAIAAGSEASVVNVAADGSRVYFVSRQQLGGEGVAGAANLYLEGPDGIRLVAVLDGKDVTKQTAAGLSLLRWTDAAVGPAQLELGGPVSDPARSSADGRYLAFESYAALTGAPTAGFKQVYRYDAVSGHLDCVSCNPTAQASTSGATLQDTLGNAANSFLAPVANVTETGAVFFESSEALVPRDVNETRDVYEWDGGVANLISSGNGASVNRLYAVSPSGRDVFFRTNDRLVGADPSSATSIYDARVGGGFPELPPTPECAGESCQRQSSGSPPVSPAGSTAVAGLEAGRPSHCRKGAHRVRRRDKARCAKEQRHPRNSGLRPAHNHGRGSGK